MQVSFMTPLEILLLLEEYSKSAQDGFVAYRLHYSQHT